MAQKRAQTVTEEWHAICPHCEGTDVQIAAQRKSQAGGDTRITIAMRCNGCGGHFAWQITPTGPGTSRGEYGVPLAERTRGSCRAICPSGAHGAE